MSREVKKLSAVDVVGEERRTWFVVEWMDSNDCGWHTVYHTAKDRDQAAKQVPDGVKEIVQYEIVALPYQSISDIDAYISSGNSRLTY
jgi:hypothetical protein